MMDEQDWPLPVRVICDSAEDVLEAMRKLPEYGEAVIVEHDGKRVAAIIPMKDLELYQQLFAEEEDRVDNAAADEALAEPGEDIPLEDLMAEFGVTAKA